MNPDLADVEREYVEAMAELARRSPAVRLTLTEWMLLRDLAVLHHRRNARTVVVGLEDAPLLPLADGLSAASPGEAAAERSCRSCAHWQEDGPWSCPPGAETWGGENNLGLDETEWPDGVPACPVYARAGGDR